MEICGLYVNLSPDELQCMYFYWFLVWGTSPPAAQLFVIATERSSGGEIYQNVFVYVLCMFYIQVTIKTNYDYVK